MVKLFPLLKRNGLDADDMANYQPISNLSFLSFKEKIFKSEERLDSREICLDAAYNVSCILKKTPFSLRSNPALGSIILRSPF